VRMQVGRALAAVVVVGAVISGCGGPAQAGTAVFIGDQAVPLEHIQSQVSSALAGAGMSDALRARDQGADIPRLSRSIVSSEVLHSVLSLRAAEYGIVVTDQQVDAEIAAGGGAEAFMQQTGLDLTALRSQIRDTLIAVQIGQRVAPRLAVTVDLVGVGTSRADAERAAHVLAAGGPEADALLAGPASQRVVYQAGSFPAGLASVLLGVPVGAVGAYQPSQNEAGWNAFRVVERRTDLPVDPATPPAITEMQASQVGVRDAQLAGEVAGIRVNPRFGQWDPIQGQVVPEGQQVGTVILPSRSAA
jgi:hypothetical protein